MVMQPDTYDTGTDDTTWYLAEARGEKAGPRLVGLCRQLALRQRQLLENTDKCIAIFQWGGDSRDLRPGDHCPIEENLVTFNAAQNTVETIWSKVMKTKISTMPLTDGGGYLSRKRAKDLGKAIDGVLDECGFDEIEEEVFSDALVTDHGSGAVKVIERRDCIELEHVPIEDVWYDEAEIRHRQPRSQFHIPREGIDKYVAAEFYAGDETRDMPGFVGTPESRREAIMRASSRSEFWRVANSPGASHRVDIFEAWHKPSGEPEEYEEEYEDDETGEQKTRKGTRHDGRHVVAVEGQDGTLIDEPWDGKVFPILQMTPRRRRRSIWGLSVMRNLIAPQREYEKLTKKIQNQHQKMGVSGFVAGKQEELNVRELKAGTHASGFVLETNSGQPPVPLVPEPVAEGTYQYAESIARNMAERYGVSTFSAASQLPPGMQQASGRALMAFQDVEDVRLLPYHRARERFRVELSWLIVAAAERISERNPSFKARYRGKRGLESISWKDVLIDREKFVLKVFPVSALSKEPSARFDQLDRMLERGSITVEQFKRLFEIPDLESENELDTADTDVIDRTLDIIVTTGRYLSPEPFDNLELMLQRAGKFYNLCRQQEVPEERLKLIRDLCEDCKSLIDQRNAKTAAAATGAPPMAGPPGMAPPMGPLPGMPGAPPMGPPGPPGMPPPAAPPIAA